MSRPEPTEIELTAAEFGRFTLPNRLVVAPMTRVSATPTGVPTPEMADYYAEFARGGFAMVVTEGTYTDAVFAQGYRNQPGLVTPEHGRGWQRVTEQVHAAGAVIVAQLMHAGALSQGNAHREDTVGPSAIGPSGRMLPEYGGSGPWPIPREATTGDLAVVVRGFADAAANAVRAGFDGVEVHAANGYLLHQFLAPHTNTRTDRYGGSLVGRLRLTVEVLHAITDRVGADFCVGVRLSQGTVTDASCRWLESATDAETAFTTLTGAGASYLHIASEGRDWEHSARLADTTVTRLARTSTGLPVIANGGMHDRDRTRRVLADGHADLVSIGHAALANPDLPRAWSDDRPLRAFDRAMLSPYATLENARRWRDAVRGGTGQVTA
ncbi:MAG TPA: NADH:flavin oxidoreductase [Actinopolymorphaceae bacterium]